MRNSRPNFTSPEHAKGKWRDSIYQEGENLMRKKKNMRLFSMEQDRI